MSPRSTPTLARSPLRNLLALLVVLAWPWAPATTRQCLAAERPATPAATPGASAEPPASDATTEAQPDAAPGTAQPTPAGAATTAAPGQPASQSDAAPSADTRPAQPGPSTPTLAPVVVDAERPESSPLVERSFDTADDTAGFGETILAAPLWRQARSTAELLGETAGAQLRRQGGRDDFASLSIRGAPAGQVRVLLDGVALGRASDSVVNLADLPAELVDRIEVYRGFAPAGLSPSSAAGVVNVVTKDPVKPTAGVAAGGGSFGTGRANAMGAGPLAGGNASAFASWRRTDGDFDYRDDNGTLYNPSDDRVRRRANNDSEAVESLLRWKRPAFEGTRVQLREHIFHKDEGVPGLARFTPPKARLETTRQVAAAALGSDRDRWNLEQDFTWEERRLSDYGAFDNTGTTMVSTSAARWGLPLGSSHWLSGSGEFSWEDFEQQSPGNLLARQSASRFSTAVATGDDWSLPRIPATLTLQLRHQELWNDGGSAGNDRTSSTDPRGGLRWEALPGLAVKGNVSTYFRPPAFDELFGRDGFTTGNPDLVPEQGLAWDAGLEWKPRARRFGELGLSWAWYGSNLDNGIVVVLTFDRTAKAVNSGKATIRGHELRAEWKGTGMLRGLAWSANATVQRAVNRSDAPGLNGKDLPGLPPVEAYSRLSWRRGPFVLAWEVDVAGRHEVDSENLAPSLPTRTVHDLSLQVGPSTRGFALSLEAQNLGNSLVPDEIGFPLPGRAYYATLSWSPPTGNENADAP